MTHKVYVVTDLGPGDGGKGSVVHAISHMTHAHTILKTGGGQGSHGVSTSGGERFAFSHWGCGTFDAIHTHLTDQMIIIPDGVLNEAHSLRYGHGIYDPFSLLTADEQALCATPFHWIASRLIELARKNKPRGTVGTGAGDAYRSYQQTPELAILAGGLTSPDLKDRLAAIREDIKDRLEPSLAREFLASDREEAATLIQWLHDDEFLEYAVRRLKEVARLLNVVSSDYLGEVILPQDGVAMVEASHGILTDRHYGLHPHTSAIRTLPRFKRDMLTEAGFEGQVVNLGVSRAYAVRHGAGPMPTASPELAETLLPGSSKGNNRYQGEVRVGPLDLVLLKYAIEASGGPQAYDGLAITWFDQIQANGEWPLCQTYNDIDPAFFLSPDRIKVREDAEPEGTKYQSELTQALENCSPQVNTVKLDPRADRDALFGLVNNTMQASLEVPVRMLSFGPTERDKLFK